VDMRCSLAKQQHMLAAILHFYRVGSEAVRRGVSAEQLGSLPQRELLSRMKEVPEPEIESYVEQFRQELEAGVKRLQS